MDASRKVLVVDDDAAVRKSIDRVLTGKGYAVITAENGEEALRKLNEEKYDLVYTDIRMPGMSGLEVAEHVKAQQPWTPVVIITGYGTDAAETRAKAAGVSNFMHKPLSPEMIEGSARDAMIAAAANKGSLLKNIALFLAAPFIGLAYIVALPIVGMAVLASLAGRAAAKYPLVRSVARVARNVTMVVVGPVIGLVSVVLFPFIGLALLAWMAGKAGMARIKG